MAHIRIHDDGQGVRTLEIHRPEKRNAIDLPMFDALAHGLACADADDTVRAVLLCGAGDGYTAGHDLQAFTQWPQTPGDPVPRFLHALAALGKPLVIAVQGWAVGIGATSLLHADWVVAEPGAALRLPFVDLNIAPEAGSSLLLARAVGTLRARQLLLSGAPVSAQQAHTWGLVTELAPPGLLHSTAIARARELAAKPAAACRRIKHWLAADAEVHARIDDEIDAINKAVLARRHPSQEATP